jgi:RNA polymerase primary sigma factor
MDRQNVADAMMIGDSHVSFDAPFKEGERATRLDHLQDASQEPPDACVADIGLRKKIEGILGTLTKREAEIIKLYFGIGCDSAHTLEDIGQIYSLTRERIRQIKEKAMRRLKHSTRSKQLRGLQE